jgi:arsenate reductase (glutaredoxin)
MHVYQYPKCSTCRKALAWLDARGFEYMKSDLVLVPIALAKLTDIHRRSGLPVSKLFNTSGESYRAGAFKDRLRTMTEEEALVALSRDGKLVKRPIVDADRVVLVGFDENTYAQRLGPGPG